MTPLDRHKSIFPLSLVLAFIAGCAPAEEPEDEHADQEDHSEMGEHHDDEDDHIELTAEQFSSAGIEVSVAAASQVSETLTLPGTVAPNVDSVTHVTPRVAGQVRSIYKHLGEGVKRGELLCIIDSVQLGAAVADYLRDLGRVQAADETLNSERGLFETLKLAEVKVLDGAIAVRQRIFDREEGLQKKAVSTVRPLLEAEKDLEAAKLDKDIRLTELQARRDTRLLALRVDLQAKGVDLTASINRLRSLGIDRETIDGLAESSPLLSGEYRVFASGTGIVVNRHITAGEFVDAGSKLFVIEDLSEVWFVASAYEQQLRSLRSGQTAYVSLDAFPETTLHGKVSFLDYHVDPISRSVGVRITLDNRQLKDWPEELPLRPGMFGRVDLETGRRQARVALPEQALVHDDAGEYVFVQIGEFSFQRRDVSVVHVAGDMIEVTSGLEPGESVAVSGTFLLKSAERMGELGAGHSH